MKGSVLSFLFTVPSIKNDEQHSLTYQHSLNVPFKRHLDPVTEIGQDT
jgi:hypothetical protein